MIILKLFINDRADPRDGDEFTKGVWHHVLVRHSGQKIDLIVDGVTKDSISNSDGIMDTSDGKIYVGVDDEIKASNNNFLQGSVAEVRWYTRGLSDTEVGCLAAGKTDCPRGVYYAKPYNTNGCNRMSEEIESLEDCEIAIKELLGDGILGNSLNGGERFGKVIVDIDPLAPYETPTRCSYREEDAQLVWNPNPTGRGHTSLAPICNRTPRGADRLTVGCLPKCLENGQWSTALPTCEKDWCNPIFEEWHCCKNRAEYQWEGDADNVNYGRAYLEMDYWVKYHDVEGYCPLGYGDCDHDDECDSQICAQKRDLDNIDVCIEDIDPCNENYATGIACVVLEAVGVDYKEAVKTGSATSMFVGGSIMILGAVLGYYYCKNRKANNEYQALLEEEL